MPNWTIEEKVTWDDLIARLTHYYYPTTVNVATEKRRAAILRADEIIKSDARFVVSIPDNDWKENDNRGVNHERWFVVHLYIEELRRSLEAQGFIIK